MPCVGVCFPGPPEHSSTFCRQTDLVPGVPGLGLGMEVYPHAVLLVRESGRRPCASPTAAQLVVSAETRSRQGQSHPMGSLSMREAVQGREMGEWAVFVLGVHGAGPPTWDRGLALPLDGSTSQSWRHSGTLGQLGRRQKEASWYYGWDSGWSLQKGTLELWTLLGC